MKKDTIYIADNGRVICLHCAGHAAKTTGRDISGQPIMEVTPQMRLEYFGQCPVTCECGKAGK